MSRNIHVALLIAAGLSALPWAGFVLEMLGGLLGLIAVALAAFLLITAQCVWKGLRVAKPLAIIAPLLTTFLLGLMSAGILPGSHDLHSVALFGLPLVLSVASLGAGIVRGVPQQ